MVQLVNAKHVNSRYANRASIAFTRLKPTIAAHSAAQLAHDKRKLRCYKQIKEHNVGLVAENRDDHSQVI